MMTTSTETRNPALAMLESLARCQRIVAQGGEDDPAVCVNDLVPVYLTRGGYIHDQHAIARLREEALDEAWPRQ